MAEPEERRVRLKFKRFLLNGGPLMPQGYRLATVEEIRKNLDMFKKWQLPVKRISSPYEERSGEIRLLDGWMPADLNAPHDTPNYNCIWNAVVKKKEWDSNANKWQNCKDFYSSNGYSMRKQLYDGINLSSEGIKVAWLHAYCYEDVELLYWLWLTSSHLIAQDYFTNEVQRQHIFMPTDHSIPLREIVRSLESREPGFQVQMVNARVEAQAVLRNASDRCRDGSGSIYLYGPTWGVAMVELAIEIYGQAFVDTATPIAFENQESVPIVTKFLSLSPDQLQNQIPNLQHSFAEVFIEAVKRGYSGLVNEMTGLGDNIARLNRADRVRALTEAVGGGYIELVRSLLDSLNSEDGVGLPEEVDEEKKTLFHYTLPYAQILQLLVQTYASKYDDVIKRQDTFGRNVLHWAAKGSYDSLVVDRLLRRIPSREDLIHSKDHQSRTPWHIAASKGDSGLIRKLLPLLGRADSPKRINYIQATDSSGQTALQMAAGEGHEGLVKMFVDEGSCPLKERDGQRKTALHHAARVKNPEAALATCKALLDNQRLTSKRSLLLWASATGIGTADEMEDVHPHVRTYLRTQKNECREHLLRAAAVNNNSEMAWELLSRGADMADIYDLDWTNSLESSEEESLKNVISALERMKEQGRDQPSMDDKLERYVFAQGLAALLLNRFVESPITVGISGEWGMGKSSLMIQTEKILLITAAQLTFPNLLPSEQFVGAKRISLSTRGGKIYQQIKRGVHILLALSKDTSEKETHKISLCTRANKIYQQIRRWLPSKDKSKKEHPLVTMLKEYQPQYHDVYKSLACMDNNQMLQSNSVSQRQEHALREVPRILTIRYNAWHYRDQNEAWAGLGVTIGKEIEKAMTRAQWMSTCWRYTWAKQCVNIWVHVFFPCLLGIFLAGWVTWLVWMLLKQAKFHGLKYGSIPITLIAIVWVVVKSVISVVKPVSKQMLGYIISPDHTSHLGYQEDVIADINFLKKELGKQPHWFFSFILGLWCWNWFGLCADNVENTSIPKFMPASEHHIRIVTFVDDLDRCEEMVILKVLSAINLVLAECKINVILGMDKKMIERAIKRKYPDADDDLAEKFICKIIQIPLSLPDPTEQESNRFLEYHLGHKMPAKYIEKKSVSRSQPGLVVPIEPQMPIEEAPRDISEAAREAENDAPRLPLARRQDVTVLNIYPCNELKQGCRGIIKRAVDWLNNLSAELKQADDESINLLRSAEGVRLIRELLLPNYTGEEASIFYKLRNFTTGSQKLPREWKRLLSYHKFAWYVLSLTGNVYSLPTWKMELVGWIFVCWQWRPEMNSLIKVWNTIIIMQDNDRIQRRSCGPPLSEIVKRCMSQLPNSQSPENEQGNNWSKLQEALKIQDVSMEGIQLFQQFRLYCEIDHLPWSYE